MVDYVFVLGLLTPVVVALIGFCTAYLAYRHAGEQQELAQMKSTAYDAVVRLLNNLLVAGKDKCVSEQEWQQIADDVVKELNKRP
jgi:hypothetical protein